MTIDWTTEKLGDVCDFQGGSQPPKSQFIKTCENGYVRLLQIRDFTSDEKAVFIPESAKNRICSEDDVMIGRYGASVGQIHRGKSGAYNVALIKTIPDVSRLDRDFFYYYLTSSLFQQPLASVAVTRSAQAGFGKADIADFPIPIPELPEQRRIVGILDEAFAGIATARANAEQNLQNAHALFESHLNAVFTQRGDGWIDTTIGDSCTLKSGTTVKKALEKPAGDFPYVKVADMTCDGNEDEVVTSTRFLNKDDIGKNATFPVGTTIFPKRGGAILTNKKKLTGAPICADLNIMGVIPSDRVLPEFLFFYFLNVDMRELGSGSSIPQINNYDIAPLAIAFPSTIDEQSWIVSRLQSLLTETLCLKSIYQRKLAALDELKKSLLHQAFNGELQA